MKTANNAQAREEQYGAAASSFFFGKARELAEFCVRNGRGGCFHGWPVPTVFTYAFFHAVQRTVFSTRASGAINSVLFVWGQPERTIRESAAEGGAVFHWQRSQDQADSLFLGEVIAGPPELRRLVKQVEARWPGWRQKKIFTFRHGKLVQLETDTIERLIS